MGKQKKAEAEKAPDTGISVETNDALEDMDAKAEKARDPYARKPKTKTATLDGGVILETYE